MSNISSPASAAVAIIRTPVPVDSVLIIKRTSRPDDPWSGHFSFPGGRRAPEDIDLLATCTRETAEETGIHLNGTTLVESLSLEPAGRNFSAPLWVQPFLFTLPHQAGLKIDPVEVESGFWLETERFLDEDNHILAETLPGREFPALPLGDYYLWGFTYRLLRKVLGMLVD